MLCVNLWELITAASRKDEPNSDKCKEIVELRGPRFGTELSLEINETTGEWRVTVFDHDSREREQSVSLLISPDGFLHVTRCRTVNIQETRTVSF